MCCGAAATRAIIEEAFLINVPRLTVSGFLDDENGIKFQYNYESRPINGSDARKFVKTDCKALIMICTFHLILLFMHK